VPNISVEIYFATANITFILNFSLHQFKIRNIMMLLLKCFTGYLAKAFLLQMTIPQCSVRPFSLQGLRFRTEYSSLFFLIENPSVYFVRMRKSRIATDSSSAYLNVNPLADYILLTNRKLPGIPISISATGEFLIFIPLSKNKFRNTEKWYKP